MANSIGFLLLLAQFPPDFQPALIPHIPKDMTSFSATLNLEGLALTGETTLTVNAHNELGQFIEEATLTLNPGERRTLALDTLFRSQDISHLTITPGLPSVGAAVAYAHRANPEKVAYLESPSTLSQQWRVYPDSDQGIFQGVAVVNAGFEPAQLTVTHHDAAGRVSGVPLEEELPPFGKILIDLTNRFTPIPGSYLALTAESFIAVVGLKGSADPETGFLVAREAQPLPPNREQWRAWFENREKWRSGGVLENHRFYFQLIETTIAGPQTLADAVGEIHDRRLVRLTDPEGSPLAPEAAVQVRTVAQVFDLVKDLLEVSDYAEVEYDRELGYPSSIYLLAPGFSDTGIQLNVDVEPLTE